MIMEDLENAVKRFLEIIKPKCPFCGADVSYAYYGYDGSRYCPHCMKKIGDVE